MSAPPTSLRGVVLRAPDEPARRGALTVWEALELLCAGDATHRVCPVLAHAACLLGAQQWFPDEHFHCEASRTKGLVPLVLALPNTFDRARERARHRALLARAIEHWIPLALRLATAALEHRGVRGATMAAVLREHGSVSWVEDHALVQRLFVYPAEHLRAERESVVSVFLLHDSIRSGRDAGVWGAAVCGAVRAGEHALFGRSGGATCIAQATPGYRLRERFLLEAAGDVLALTGSAS